MQKVLTKVLIGLCIFASIVAIVGVVESNNMGLAERRCAALEMIDQVETDGKFDKDEAIKKCETFKSTSYKDNPNKFVEDIEKEWNDDNRIAGGYDKNWYLDQLK